MSPGHFPLPQGHALSLSPSNKGHNVTTDWPSIGSLFMRLQQQFADSRLAGSTVLCPPSFCLLTP